MSSQERALARVYEQAIKQPGGKVNIEADLLRFLVESRGQLLHYAMTLNKLTIDVDRSLQRGREILLQLGL